MAGRRLDKLCLIFCLFVCIVIVMFGLSCLKSHEPNSYIYRLSRGGYSSVNDTLLYAVHINIGDVLSGVSLAMYNEDKRVNTYLSTPIYSGPFDFAWSPKEQVFVVTHGDRVSLFQKSASSNNYFGTAIRCPLGIHYTFCAWNASGDWLAVNCGDLGKLSGHHKLGLYNIMDEKFVITQINMDHRPPIWKDDVTLYVPNNNRVIEMRIDSGEPHLIRTIPIEEGPLVFYGMFDDDVLIQKDKRIKLGNKLLLELDRNSRTAVMITRTFIFVSASSTSLVVFDQKGRELSRTDPGKTIRFGSAGKDPNTVYGLAESTLLRICIENGSLNIQELCDLADFK